MSAPVVRKRHDGKIQTILKEGELLPEAKEVFDAGGRLLIPGVIDDQVHFREPGLTHKADIYTESRAAVAGGITSFMEMPNTNPQTITIEELEKKYKLAASRSLSNFAFYLGATNDNLEEIRKLKPGQSAGIKIFMGASTGNMLVDRRLEPKVLSEIRQIVTLLSDRVHGAIVQRMEVDQRKLSVSVSEQTAALLGMPEEDDELASIEAQLKKINRVLGHHDRDAAEVVEAEVDDSTD